MLLIIILVFMVSHMFTLGSLETRDTRLNIKLVLTLYFTTQWGGDLILSVLGGAGVFHGQIVR